MDELEDGLDETIEVHTASNLDSSFLPIHPVRSIDRSISTSKPSVKPIDPQI